MTRKEEEKVELIHKEQSYVIIGACMAAYKDKGCGFLDPVYHECLAIEFEIRGIPFLSKPPQTLQYRGRALVQTFSPDFLCYEKIILEIKAVSALVDEHRAQRNGLQVRIACKLRPLPKPAIRAAPTKTPGTRQSSALKIFACFVCFVGKEIFKTGHCI